MTTARSPHRRLDRERTGQARGSGAAQPRRCAAGRLAYRLGSVATGLAAVALAVGLAACGDDDPDTDVGAGDDTTTSSPPAVGDRYGGPAGAADDGGGADAPAAVVAEGFEFSASPVAAGSEVTFANEDSAPHTMTADDGSFDSGSVAPGESATITAPTEPGDHAFHCTIHPDMQATLTVE